MRPIICVALAVLAMQVQAREPEIVEPAPTDEGVSASEYSTDLLQLYQESRLEDPRVLIAHSRLQASKEQQREAFGGLLPQVSINAGQNRITQDNEQVRRSYDSENYSIALSQVIYNKAAWESWKKFKSLTKQSAWETDLALAEATVDLAQRYFNALAADDEWTLIQSELQVTQKNLDRVNALYEKQMVMVTDQLEIQSRVDTLVAQEVEARNQVRLTRVALSEIIGRPVKEQLSRVRDDIELEVSDASLEEWVQLAISQSPPIKAAESAIDVAQAAMREGRSGHYPSVSLSLRAQQTNEGYNNALAPETDSYVASLNLQVPLYSGGATSARVRGLHEELNISEQQLEAVRREVIREITNAYLTADSSVEKMRANRNALASAKQSRLAAEKSFTFAVINAVDVLTAVQNEYAARRTLLATQYDFITNLFILNRWAGKLSTESVESVNAWLGDSSGGQALDEHTASPSGSAG